MRPRGSASPRLQLPRAHIAIFRAPGTSTLSVDCSRLLCANSSHSPTAWRTGQIDRGCAKTQREISYSRSGREISAIFLTLRGDRARNLEARGTAQSFHTAWTPKRSFGCIDSTAESTNPRNPCRRRCGPPLKSPPHSSTASSERRFRRRPLNDEGDWEGAKLRRSRGTARRTRH
jgi:hypothetical protein